MTNNDGFFTSEEIDEQIESLSQRPDRGEEADPEAARVISHLRQFYAIDSTKYTPNLERAWQRIIEDNQHTKQDSHEKGHLIFMQEQQEKRKIQQPLRNKRQFAQWFGILVSIAMFAIIAGSTLFALNTIRHAQNVQTTTKPNTSTLTGSGGTPLPKAPHPITGGSCTLDTTKTHPQQSHSNIPGLYIYSQNTQGDNVLYRYDPQTKKVVWSIKFCNAFDSNGTVEKDGILYLAGIDTTKPDGWVSYLYALNETDGSVIWGVQFPAKLMYFPKTGSPNAGSSPLNLSSIETPIIANGTVYVALRSGIVYALSTANGGQLWTYNTGRNSWAAIDGGGGSISDPTIQVINGVVYGSIVDRLFALNAQSGKQLWMQNFNNSLAINQPPAIANGTIYITTDVPSTGIARTANTHVYAFDTKTGAQKWVTTKITEYVNNPTVSNNKVNIISNDGSWWWYTLNAATGMIESQTTLTNVGTSAPALINGTLYSITDTTLSVLNPDGSAKWSVAMTAKYPFIDDVQNGIIYVTGRGSGIYAYSATNGSLLWHYEGYLPQPEGIAMASIVS